MEQRPFRLTGWPAPIPKRSADVLRYPDKMKACCGTCMHSKYTRDSDILPLRCMIDRDHMLVYGEFLCCGDADVVYEPAIKGVVTW